MLRIDSLDWKRALSLIREGDFAHAGEVEAIELCFKDIAKDAGRNLLDVGCGLGGTADYIKKHGWGNVTGIDMQADIVESAKKRYPSITFHSCDVTTASDIVKNEFDIIYMFNSFYAFEDQERALRELRRLADDDTQLIIFDYVDKREERAGEIFKTCRNPIVMAQIDELLSASGWDLYKERDLTPQYEYWYQKFVHRIESKNREIIEIIGDDGYELFRSFYMDMLQLVRDDRLGGCTIYARGSRR